MFLKLISLAENDINQISKNNQIPTRTDYVKKTEVDRLTLYTFDGPFQLVHGDAANSEFLGKSAIIPPYVPLAVDLYSSKVYVYPMQSNITDNAEIKSVSWRNEKQKKKSMQLQVDNEFQQVKIKDLNDKYNFEMFSIGVREGKAFAAEQKITELKSRIAKLSALTTKVPSTTIILQSAENMNNGNSKKYGITPDKIEQKSLSSEKCKILFNFHRIERSKTTTNRLDRYDKKNMPLKNKTYVKI